MIDAEPTKKAKRYYTKHGLTTLKKAVRVLGGRAIDRRTALGRALEDWRHSILSDLGGIDQTSTQQRQLVDLAVKTKLILDSIDAYLVKQPSLVNHRKRALLPVVKERQGIADSLAKYMTQLGLERKAKVLPSLSEYLNGNSKPKSSVPASPSAVVAQVHSPNGSDNGQGAGVQEVQPSQDVTGDA